MYEEVGEREVGEREGGEGRWAAGGRLYPPLGLFSLLTHNFQLTGLTTVCILVANTRKLALYTCNCINCYNMKTKNLHKNYKYIITHYWISVKMAPSAKLTVISKMDGDASLVKNRLILLHFLYILVEKQPYLVSTSSYQLTVNNILFLMCVQFWWCLEKSCKTKWQIVMKLYATVILDNQTMWSS